VQVVPQADGSAHSVLLWDQAFAYCRSVTPASEQWFSSVQFEGFAAGRLNLAARDEFVRDWIRDHYQAALVDAFSRLTGAPVDVTWRVTSNIQMPAVPVGSTDPTEAQRRPRRLQIGQSYDASRTANSPISGAAISGAAIGGAVRHAPLTHDVEWANDGSSEPGWS
jgi:chromosomal replication initiation ATPase DnaA